LSLAHAAASFSARSLHDALPICRAQPGAAALGGRSVRRSGCRRARRSSRAGRAAGMLSLDRVTYLHRGGDGIREVSLSVGAGEIVALVGLNGAGKTTLLRLLLGMLRPQAGRVSVLGRPLVSMPRQQWSRVGHLVDSPLAYPELT